MSGVREWWLDDITLLFEDQQEDEDQGLSVGPV